ncbi:MAG: Stp1/IreP family PP2C-type Ser/Thr phosphatase [Bdellovibrionales bacterium]|jgi:PPM family protein phosphatase|nr:Stp1/IreP family PP2C-type Ser/Thr phosphatase [Bdellovibrionales bacterium]MBT3526234.1 Stp1/IreP family PP2C-type Ser/Thr phosphatase [Bdellovibrionales bacterium]MBT7670560.1 Stp1/IreP family PP2C-type Ser/Thr phosphatase [Bdellovibrionales bacterium]MBT7766435.1 Stp1/IreP family PP2C-type Ser/Thr phosphatase [Bdellovibrionales bacterium]
MQFVSAGLTDIGRKRKTNQDAIYVGEKEGFFLVADGMGGHQGGDIASKMAVDSIPAVLTQNRDVTAEESLRKAIQYTNGLIHRRGEEDSQLKGMGTTVVSLYFQSDSLLIGNVGDSRAYLVNQSEIYQLTKDHTLIQEKLNLGIYDREKAAKDPHSNVLVRTVGFSDEVEVDLYGYQPEVGDLLLICSDGLYGKVSDHDILQIINNAMPEQRQHTAQSLAGLTENLIERANLNGGNDNISVITVVVTQV